MRRAPRPEGRATPAASRRSTLASASRHMSAVPGTVAKRSRDWYGGTSLPVTCTAMIRALLKATKELSAAHPKRSEGGVQTLRRVLVLLLLAVSCAPPPTTQLPVTCGATHGGHPGAETQLRFVEATETEIVLTFGASSASNVFDVPAFELTPLEGAGSPRAYRLKVSGSSTLNPDGTASYRGLKGLEPGGRTARAIDLIDESARVVTFTVALERDVCPFVAAKVYQYGKSPRAQIALTFGGASALTIETISDAVGGAPIGTPGCRAAAFGRTTSTITSPTRGPRASSSAHVTNSRLRRDHRRPRSYDGCDCCVTRFGRSSAVTFGRTCVGATRCSAARVIGSRPTGPLPPSTRAGPSSATCSCPCSSRSGVKGDASERAATAAAAGCSSIDPRAVGDAGAMRRPAATG